MSEYVYRSHGEPLVNERGEIHLARAGEVVRCRDCKYLWVANGKRYCDFHYMSAVVPDDFCSWGERKEDEQS